MANKLALNFDELKGYANWNLLTFLLLFLNVKLAVKIPAIIIIFLLQPDFKFGFSLKNTRLPIFYPAVIVIALLNWVFTSQYHHTDYTLVLLTGIGFWGLCILASHQVKYLVDHHQPQLIHRAILIFFILNAVFSVANIASIIWETGSVNPYQYRGQYQKYFIGTGDFIKGITFDTSTTNALLNAFGVVYFITRKNLAMVCTCMVVLLLTGSNATNIIVSIVLLLLFFFRSDKTQKSLILTCTLFMAIFLAKVSPQNNNYAIKTFRNLFGRGKQQMAYALPSPALPLRDVPDSQLTPELRRKKKAQMFIDSVSEVAFKKDHPNTFAPRHSVLPFAGPINIPQPDLNARSYQESTDTDASQLNLLGFIKQHRANLPLSRRVDNTPHLPGKVIGMMQTISFLRQHPARILAGDGVGNFSSKLAFRATDLGFAGGYPHKYVYISPDFLTNHLDVYLNFFSKPIGYRSLANSPYGTYDQLLGEYGLLGIAVFLIGYLWFFARHYHYLTYGIPVLLLMIAGFFTDYWFEQLSVVVFFELLLFLDIKEHQAVPALQSIPDER